MLQPHFGRPDHGHSARPTRAAAEPTGRADRDGCVDDHRWARDPTDNHDLSARSLKRIT
jgi:hypothetical protein